MSLFEILHAVKRPTILKLSAGVDKGAVLAGKLAAVNSSGELEIAGNNSAAVVGVFQTEAAVPAYQSTGLLDGQVNGAVGSAGGGNKVSLVAGAGAVIKTDQVAGTPAAGALLGSDASGLFKAHASGTVVGIVLKADADGYVIQLRI
jgi:hypothetical protein